MLQWYFYINYILLGIIISFVLYNKTIFQLLILGEVIIMLFFILGLTLLGVYNIYYLLGFSIILLILGGLELALNLLLLVI